MKRLVSQLTVLMVLGAAAGMVASCAKQSGPLSPSIPYLTAANPANGSLPTVTTGAPSIWPTAVSQTAQVYFSMPMDPASLVAGGTVSVYTMNDDGKSETQYPNFTASYNTSNKCLTLTPTGGAWANNKAYHFVFTTGCLSVNGKPLDGNYNKVQESAEFDTMHMFATIGTPLSPGYGLSDWNNGIQVVGYTVSTIPQGGMSPHPVTGYLGDVNPDAYGVTITVAFSPNAFPSPDFQMDTTTFFTSDTVLHPNISVVDAATNAPVAPVYVTVPASAGTAYNMLSARFTPAAGTKLKLKIRGGINGVRSSNAATLNLMRGLYFSGSGNGRPQATDDSKEVTIQLRPTTGQVPYVLVTGSAYESATRRIVVTFNVPTGNGTLDAATINSSTFHLIDMSTNPYTSFASAGIVVDNSSAPNPKVYVYIPTKFYVNTATSANRDVRLIVTKDVKSSDGFALDQNNDQVLGTEFDNYDSYAGNANTYFSIYNYVQ